ncbi:hypothetical protein [Microbacterium atlanticum]|uniref:hypothetical protein n=1 Tax=Microbacterium atlanticum TaxID=2782168 RepID=UPI001E5619B5|nr:hypothetical protein [Microbacterium atlanticum]
MTDEIHNAQADETAADDPQYGVGPFSIREVALVGTWLVAFVVSFFPFIGDLGEGPSVWTHGIDWVLAIGLPTVAVFLIVLRRLSPQGIRRVGSLGIDQFASVAFSIAAVTWLNVLWHSFISLAEVRFFAATWVAWVEFFLMLAGVVLTVVAPFIAPFAQDFRGRPEAPAHRNARQVRPVTPRPLVERPVRAEEPAPHDAAAAGPYAGPTPYAGTVATEPAETRPSAAAHAEPAVYAPGGDEEVDGLSDRGRFDESTTTVIPLEPETEAAAGAHATPTVVEPAQSRESFEHVENPSSTVEPATTTTPQSQAFWALVPEERDVVDEIGIPVFRIGPTAWALVIEDRGDAFVVRHEDGRIGYLHDVSGVTRG